MKTNETLKLIGDKAFLDKIYQETLLMRRRIYARISFSP